jgi:hypothetical protein
MVISGEITRFEIEEIKNKKNWYYFTSWWNWWWQ